MGAHGVVQPVRNKQMLTCGIMRIREGVSVFKSYSTRRKKPTQAHANAMGFLFARASGRVSYSGVKWDAVKWPDYDRWSPAEFYRHPGDKTGEATGEA